MDNRKIYIAAGGLVIILLVGWGVWWATHGTKQREIQLRQALENTWQAQTYHAVAELELHLPATQGQRKRPLNNVVINVEGDTQHQGPIPEFAGQFKIEAKGAGLVLFSNGDARLLSDAVAFRLDSLPALFANSEGLTKKWTYVSAVPLKTDNPRQVREALLSVLTSLHYAGRENQDLSGKTEATYHYSGTLNTDQEQQLVNQWKAEATHNRALNILARLLGAYNVRSIDIWLDGSNHLRLIEVSFQDRQDKSIERAKLKLSFSDFGKKVTIDRPKKELTVKPEVFAKIFGTGEVNSSEAITASPTPSPSPKAAGKKR
jgi:hypothetical protein